MYTPEIGSGSETEATDYCESPDLLNLHNAVIQPYPEQPVSDCDDLVVDEYSNEEDTQCVANKAQWDTMTAFSQLDGFADSFLMKTIEPPPAHEISDESTMLDDSKDITTLAVSSACVDNVCVDNNVVEGSMTNSGTTTVPNGKKPMSEMEHIKILHEKLPQIQSAFSLYSTYDRTEMKVILRNGNIKFNGKDDKSILANRMLECLQEGKLFKAHLKQGLHILPKPTTPVALLTKKRKSDIPLKPIAVMKKPNNLVTKSLSMNSTFKQVSHTTSNNSNTTTAFSTPSAVGTANSNHPHKPAPSVQNPTVPNTKDNGMKQGIITMFNPNDYRKSTVIEGDITGRST